MDKFLTLRDQLTQTFSEKEVDFLITTKTFTESQLDTYLEDDNAFTELIENMKNSLIDYYTCSQIQRY